MAKKIYNNEQLWEMTVVELRELCRKYGIGGMSKQRKEIIVEAIEDYYQEIAADNTPACAAPAPKSKGKLDTLTAELSVDTAKSPTHILTVSCGAASDGFAVTGYRVSEVANLLKDVLNIPDLSNALVNGDKVSSDYVLKKYDTLEFLKPAGKKG